MGTSASTQIIKKGEVISLSQRSDGYPTFVLKNLGKWITSGDHDRFQGLAQNVESLQIIHLMSYSEEVRNNSQSDIPYQGLDLYKDAVPNTETDTHTWCYVVDLDQRLIKVFCNDSYIDPRDENLTISPLEYLKAICEEALVEEETQLRTSMNALLAAGFAIN